MHDRPNVEIASRRGRNYCRWDDLECMEAASGGGSDRPWNMHDRPDERHDVKAASGGGRKCGGRNDLEYVERASGGGSD